jgi:hypothetical protein
MDKLHKLKKDIKTVRRNELFVRILKYSAMTIGAAALLLFSFIRVTGNRIDIGEREFKPTGLVQFESSPAGATVTMDDRELSPRTPGEVVADVGSHSVRFSLNGYHDWNKSFSINQGQVLWLNYALLIPRDLQTDEIANIDYNIKSLTRSRDSKWALLQYTDFNKFALLSVDNPINIRVTNFSLPADILSTPDVGTTASITVIEGDYSSRYFLLRHDFTSDNVAKKEFIYFDRRDLNAAYNLTREFAIDVKKIVFDENNERRFYIVDANDNLRSLNHNDKSMSTPVVAKVLTFSQYRDKVITVALGGKDEQTVGVTYNDKYFVLKTFPANIHVEAYFMNYFNRDYVVLTDGQQLYLIANPLDERWREEQILAIDAPKIDWVQVNGSGRIILVGNGQQVISYDQETHERVEYPAVNRPRFLDDFHVFWQDGTTNMLADFDGSNSHSLPLNTPTLFLSNDKKYLFSLGVGEVKTIFQRSRLVIN